MPPIWLSRLPPCYLTFHPDASPPTQLPHCMPAGYLASHLATSPLTRMSNHLAASPSTSLPHSSGYLTSCLSTCPHDYLASHLATSPSAQLLLHPAAQLPQLLSAQLPGLPHGCLTSHLAAPRLAAFSAHLATSPPTWPPPTHPSHPNYLAECRAESESSH